MKIIQRKYRIVHHSTMLGYLKIRCGTKDFRNCANKWEGGIAAFHLTPLHALLAHTHTQTHSQLKNMLNVIFLRQNPITYLFSILYSKTNLSRARAVVSSRRTPQMLVSSRSMSALSLRTKLPSAWHMTSYWSARSVSTRMSWPGSGRL